MTSPAAVSRALRTAGFNPLPSGTPRHREGVRVEWAAKILGTVRVSIDTGLKSRDSRLFDQMRDALSEAGYAVDGSSTWDGENYLFSSLTVSKP